MNHRTLAIGLVTVVTFITPAHADFFNNASGLAAPQQVLDFETVTIPPNDPVTDQFASFGVTFAGAFSDPDTSSFANIDGHRIGNFQANVGASPWFTIDFAYGVSQVGFALVSAPGSATFEALLDGTVVDAGAAMTSASGSSNFYGFENVVFDQLRISVDSFDNAFLLDNLQTVPAAPVPEPETWALMIAGLGIVGNLGRLRRRRNGRE